MTIVKRLIAETPNFEYDTIFEEANLQQAPKLYIQGPFFQYGVVNKNKRMYQEEDMIREVKRYIAEDIAENRAGGELEHSSAPSLDLRNMADRILELKQEDRVYKNKSATGIYMRSGRTVATDWSKIPVDTIMRIDGKEYRVEDYGSALVRDTSKPIVDLYVNNRKEIHKWGKRDKTVEIVKWGSFTKSMEILQDRIHYKHCRTMYYKIRHILKS